MTKNRNPQERSSVSGNDHASYVAAQPTGQEVFSDTDAPEPITLGELSSKGAGPFPAGEQPVGAARYLDEMNRMIGEVSEQVTGLIRESSGYVSKHPGILVTAGFALGVAIGIFSAMDGRD